jgi:hypothetical protein
MMTSVPIVDARLQRNRIFAVNENRESHLRAELCTVAYNSDSAQKGDFRFRSRIITSESIETKFGVINHFIGYDIDHTICEILPKSGRAASWNMDDVVT